MDNGKPPGISSNEPEAKSRWQQQPGTKLMIALVTLSVGVLVYLVSLPLVYRKVPMNYFYGFRIPAAFESDERWYEINAYGGRQMAAWSWLIVAAGVVGFFMPRDTIPIYTPASTFVILLAVLIPIIRITRWARRLPPSEASLSNVSQVIPEGFAPTSETSNRHVFLMKRTLIPALVLLLLCVGYVVFVANSASQLPERVATHFGGDGRPNGWMERQSYLHFIAILGLALAFLMAGLGFVLGIMQVRLKPAVRRGTPSTKRLNQNLSWLSGDMLWLACLMLGFIAGTHYLTLEANRSHPAQLSMSSLAILVAGFGAGMIGWTLLLVFHLMRKSESFATGS
jgi:uncharacterized membrane protein